MIFLYQGINTGLKMQVAITKKVITNRIIFRIEAVEAFSNKNIVLIHLEMAKRLDVIIKNQQYVSDVIFCSVRL